MKPLKLVVSGRSKPLWAIIDLETNTTLFRLITEYGTQFMTYVEEQLGRRAFL